MVSTIPDSDRALTEALEGVKSRMLTPALVVDLSAAGHNIAAIQRRIDASRASWRPHIKTVKQAAMSRKSGSHVFHVEISLDRRDE